MFSFLLEHTILKVRRFYMILSFKNIFVIHALIYTLDSDLVW